MSPVKHIISITFTNNINTCTSKSSNSGSSVSDRFLSHSVILQTRLILAVS
ncbi:hypothetical protein RRG08_000924 [Elysia crispata]|uniref:Uncharacterized protein n=1 Tax=Elysia crispata TaxID=231223 RepID=A0AAE0Z649_9GAST|nr:hypothetical protein RRG08_000924 [Elysia crispata]